MKTKIKTITLISMSILFTACNSGHNVSPVNIETTNKHINENEIEKSIVGLHFLDTKNIHESDICTGTIISEDNILTAGHCLSKWNDENNIAVTVSYHDNTTEKFLLNHKKTHYYNEEAFDSGGTVTSDIGILNISQNFDEINDNYKTELPGNYILSADMYKYLLDGTSLWDEEIVEHNISNLNLKDRQFYLLTWGSILNFEKKIFDMTNESIKFDITRKKLGTQNEGWDYSWNYYKDSDGNVYGTQKIFDLTKDQPFDNATACTPKHEPNACNPSNISSFVLPDAFYDQKYVAGGDSGSPLFSCDKDNQECQLLGVLRGTNSEDKIRITSFINPEAYDLFDKIELNEKHWSFY